MTLKLSQDSFVDESSSELNPADLATRDRAFTGRDPSLGFGLAVAVNVGILSLLAIEDDPSFEFDEARLSEIKELTGESEVGNDPSSDIWLPRGIVSCTPGLELSIELQELSSAVAVVNVGTAPAVVSESIVEAGVGYGVVEDIGGNGVVEAGVDNGVVEAGVDNGKVPGGVKVGVTSEAAEASPLTSFESKTLAGAKACKTESSTRIELLGKKETAVFVELSSDISLPRSITS